MAVSPLGADTPAVTIPGTFPPAPAVMRLLSQFDRDKLGNAIEVMIALLDADDPDPEAEEIPVEDAMITYDLPPAEDPTETDMEENDLEDSFVLSHLAIGSRSGPGCGIADPDHCRAGEDKIEGGWDEKPGDPDDCEVAYAEWHTLPASTRRAGNLDTKPIDPWRTYIPEDSEEDDPAGQSDEDGINTCLGEVPRNDGAGCLISDPDHCLAGDDRVRSGAATSIGLLREDDGPGDDTDAEREQIAHDVPMLSVRSLDYNLFNDKRTPLGISNLMTSFVGRDVRSADTGAIHTGRSSGRRSRPGVPI